MKFAFDLEMRQIVPLDALLVFVALWSGTSMATQLSEISCRAELMGSTSEESILSEPSKLRNKYYTTPIKLKGRRVKLETKVYIVWPNKVKKNTPVTIMPPGLSKAMFFEQANELAKLGHIAVSYNHLNVGDPVVGPVEAPTVEEDAQLALQVFQSLPANLKKRRIILAPHSRGALVAGALSHLLLKKKANLIGVIAFQPYIYWGLEHMINQISTQMENGISTYLKSLVPFFARILTPVASKYYDSNAELAAKTLATTVREMIFNALVAAQSAQDTAAESINLPTILQLALEKVLPNADDDEIQNILEKLKGMQPSLSDEAPFLGDYLVGLKIPIIIISAEHDDLSTVEMAESLEEFTQENDIPNVGYVLLADQGHYHPYEKPREMAQMILEFEKELRN